MSFKINGLNFAIDLYKRILEENPNENFIFSPFSIEIALGMINSATEDQTAAEISKILKSSDRTKIEGHFMNILNANQAIGQLHMANKLYAQNGNEFINEFKKIAKEYFHSETENVDFTKTEETAEKMNNWVESKTTGKIQNIIKSEILNPETNLAMINALYLKANWENNFHKVSTHKNDFWNNEHDKVETDFMSVYEGYYQYCELENLNAKVLQLNYEGKNLKILFIVPNDKTGLENLEKNIQNVNIFEINDKCRKTLINLSVPKFKVEFSIDLLKSLYKLGMTKISTDDANFTNSIVAKNPIKLSQIIHKICFDVNEEGTEAVPPEPHDFNLCICPGCHKEKPKNLNINRPFLYAVIDDNSIYYFGRVKSM